MFHANFGQHSAVMAGLAYARGEYVVTLDADLQNPPEEIGKLVGMLEQGYDYVGTIRQQRQDSWWRRWFSKRINKLREWITPVRITDQGCMMRGYARSVVTALNQTREVNTFIPALASLYAMNPIEVPIAHEERFAGRSKYSMYSLIRLNFDLITGFSVVPLQLFSMVGMLIAMFSRLLFLVSAGAPDHGSARGGRTVHPVRVRVLPDRRGAVRHRPAGRICRAHLCPGARAAALHRGGGPGGRAAYAGAPGQRGGVRRRNWPGDARGGVCLQRGGGSLCAGAVGAGRRDSAAVHSR